MRVLLTWELGSGFGHWANLRPIAERFSQHHCEVFAALRDVSIPAGPWKGPAEMKLLPAPRYSTPVALRHPEPHTCVRLLESVGYHDTVTLTQLISAWRAIFELVEPDLICFEYSPTALLAARDLTAKKIVLGTGFCSPPTISPIPDLRFWCPLDNATLVAEEMRLLTRINRALANLKITTLSSLSELFAEVDQNLLLVLPELDHYGIRPGTRYWGSYALGKSSVSWPNLPSDRPSVFAYLKSCPQLPEILKSLCNVGCRLVVYIPGDSGRRFRQQIGGDLVTFLDGPADLVDVARHCTTAVLNGNLATATALLLQGIPSVNIPLHIEQLVTCHRLTGTGAAVWCRPDRPSESCDALAEVLFEHSFKQRAAEIASHHRDYQPEVVRERVLNRISSVLSDLSDR